MDAYALFSFQAPWRLTHPGALSNGSLDTGIRSMRVHQLSALDRFSSSIFEEKFDCVTML